VATQAVCVGADPGVCSHVFRTPISSPTPAHSRKPASLEIGRRFCVFSLQAVSGSVFDRPNSLWHFPMSMRADVLRRVRCAGWGFEEAVGVAVGRCLGVPLIHFARSCCFPIFRRLQELHFYFDADAGSCSLPGRRAQAARAGNERQIALKTTNSALDGAHCSG